jgi:chromosome segregation ATPase
MTSTTLTIAHATAYDSRQQELFKEECQGSYSHQSELQQLTSEFFSGWLKTDEGRTILATVKSKHAIQANEDIEVSLKITKRQLTVSLAEYRTAQEERITSSSGKDLITKIEKLWTAHKEHCLRSCSRCSHRPPLLATASARNDDWKHSHTGGGGGGAGASPAPSPQPSPLPSARSRSHSRSLSGDGFSISARRPEHSPARVARGAAAAAASARTGTITTGGGISTATFSTPPAALAAMTCYSAPATTAAGLALHIPTDSEINEISQNIVSAGTELEHAQAEVKRLSEALAASTPRTVQAEENPASNHSSLEVEDVDTSSLNDQLAAAKEKVAAAKARFDTIANIDPKILRKTILYLQSANTALKEQLKQLQAAQAGKEAEIATLQEKEVAHAAALGKAETAREKLAGEKAAVESQFAAASENLEQARAASLAIEAQLNDQKQKLEAATQEKSRLADQVSNLESEKSALETAKATAESQRSTLQGEKDASDAALQAKTTAFEQLSEAKSKLAAQLSEKEGELGRANEALETSKAKASELDRQLSELKSAAEENSRKLQAAQSEAETLRGEISTANDAKNSAVTSLNASGEEKDRRLAELTQKIEANERAVSELQAAKAALTREKDAAEAALHEARTSLATETEKNKSLTQEIRDIRSESEKVTSKSAEQEETIRSLRRENFSLSTAKAQAEATIEKLAPKLEEAKEKLEALEPELKKKTEALTQLQSEHDKLKLEKTVAEGEIERLHEQLSQVKAALAEASAKANAAETRATALEGELEGIKGELRAAKERIRELEEELAKLRAQAQETATAHAKEIGELNGKLSAANVAITALTAEKGEIQSKLETANLLNEESQRGLTTLRNSVASQKAALLSKTTECERLEQQVAAGKQASTEKDGELSALKGELATARTEQGHLKAALEKGKGDLTAAEGTARQHADTIASLKQAATENTTALKNATAMITALKEKLAGALLSSEKAATDKAAAADTLVESTLASIESVKKQTAEVIERLTQEKEAAAFAQSDFAAQRVALDETRKQLDAALQEKTHLAAQLEVLNSLAPASPPAADPRRSRSLTPTPKTKRAKVIAAAVDGNDNARGAILRRIRDNERNRAASAKAVGIAPSVAGTVLEFGSEGGSSGSSSAASTASSHDANETPAVVTTAAAAAATTAAAAGAPVVPSGVVAQTPPRPNLFALSQAQAIHDAGQQLNTQTFMQKVLAKINQSAPSKYGVGSHPSFVATYTLLQTDIGQVSIRSAAKAPCSLVFQKRARDPLATTAVSSTFTINFVITKDSTPLAQNMQPWVTDSSFSPESPVGKKWISFTKKLRTDAFRNKTGDGISWKDWEDAYVTPAQQYLNSLSSALKGCKEDSSGQKFGEFLIYISKTGSDIATHTLTIKLLVQLSGGARAELERILKNQEELKLYNATHLSDALRVLNSLRDLAREFDQVKDALLPIMKQICDQPAPSISKIPRRASLGGVKSASPAAAAAAGPSRIPLLRRPSTGAQQPAAAVASNGGGKIPASPQNF